MYLAINLKIQQSKKYSLKSIAIKYPMQGIGLTIQ